MAGATDGAVGVGVGLHAAVDDVLSPYHRRMYTAARAAAGNFFWFAGVVNNDNVMITKHPPPIHCNSLALCRFSFEKGRLGLRREILDPDFGVQN